MNWQEFFNRYGEHTVALRFYDTNESVTVEELYRAFADRQSFEATPYVSKPEDLGEP